MSSSFDDVLSGWSNDDLGNLAVLLGLGKKARLTKIKDRIKWLYHSKTRANAESAVSSVNYL